MRGGLIHRCVVLVLAFFCLAVRASSVQAATITFTKLADTSTTAPGHGVFTAFIEPPSVSSGNAAFEGFYSGGKGIYSAVVGGGVSKVVDVGDTVPGQATPFAGFRAFPTVGGNNVAFTALFGASGQGVYSGTVGTPGAVRIADTSTAPPGHGNFTFFGDTANSGNVVTFNGNYGAPGAGGGILNGTAGSTGSSTIDPLVSRVSSAVSGNRVVSLSSTFGGIYSSTIGATGSPTTVVDTTQNAPGQLKFNNFDAPSIDGSTVAFSARFNTASGNGFGIYTVDVSGSGLTKIADTSDVAPGGNNSVFTSLSLASINGGSVAFNGAYSGGSAGGLYVWQNGTITPVLLKGQALFGSTVSLIGMQQFGFDGNNIGFMYTLANGSSGLAVASLPEPSSALACMGLASLLLRRRRRRPTR